MPNWYPRSIDLLFDEEPRVPQVLADDDVASLDLGCGRTMAMMRNNSELQPFAAWGADERSHYDKTVVVVYCRLHTQRSTAVCLPASSRRAQSSDAPTTSA